jgi:crotonobetainyl-CoA:carnitine CoA-transferase CaiB-like acyl-CoA transferase
LSRRRRLDSRERRNHADHRGETPEEPAMQPPSALSGLRVLDCTHVIAGAWCSMMLADLGADVVKIEPPAGEVTRGHPKAKFKAFDFVNRNKRAIAVDLNKPEGAAVVRRLAKTADIFVENYRPGVLKRMGLGYDDLAAINPGLIYCSVSGFGLDGPYADRGGFDLIAQGMSGIMSFTGEPGAERPVAAGVPLSDLNAGTFAALGVLAALNHRHRTGEGQHVQTSLLESALAYTIWESGLYLTTGEVARPVGTRHRLAAPYEALKTGDGFIVVGVNSQRLWERFCDAIGAPELLTDPDYANPRERVVHRDALRERIEAVFAADTTANWTRRLLAKGVPCGPINTIDQAIADPQIAARGLLSEVEGRRFIRAPVGFSRTPAAIRRGVAAIGQHSGEVLAEAGFSRDEIETLVANGAVATPQSETHQSEESA